MCDEAVTALKGIVELLKKRVEQEDNVAARAVEANKRAVEMSIRMQSRSEEMQARSEESRRRIEEMRKQPSPENREKYRADMERRHEDERQFRQRMISELEKHNALLGEILVRLGKSSKTQ